MARHSSESEMAAADRITLWTIGAIVILCLLVTALLYFL